MRPVLHNWTALDDALKSAMGWCIHHFDSYLDFNLRARDGTDDFVGGVIEQHSTITIWTRPAHWSNDVDQQFAKLDRLLRQFGMRITGAEVSQTIRFGGQHVISVQIEVTHFAAPPDPQAPAIQREWPDARKLSVRVRKALDFLNPHASAAVVALKRESMTRAACAEVVATTLLRCGIDQFLAQRNCGQRALAEAREFLGRCGVKHWNEESNPDASLEAAQDHENDGTMDGQGQA